MRTALDHGQRSPRKLLRAVIARLLGGTARSEGGATAALTPLRIFLPDG
jgi:hypothetical protein